MRRRQRGLRSTPEAIRLAVQEAELDREMDDALAAIGIEALEAGREVVQQAIAARSAFPLKFGDCFAYAHARLRGEALITLDDDFLRTDLPKVLHPHAPAPAPAPASASAPAPR